jgi:starch-binding outer membrane protein, SusD/RagB family
MKSIISKFLMASILAVVLLSACNKGFLDSEPKGSLDETTLSTEKGLNKLLIGAYAMLDGHDGGLNIGGEWGSGGSNFLFGGIGGGEANKGSDPGDQGGNMTNVQRHDYTPNNGAFNDRWKCIYEGVKRSNDVLNIVPKVTLTDAVKANIVGQARLLRAWFHFQARITFGKVPYIDEVKALGLADGSIPGVPNTTEIWPEIIADAKYAYDNLPARQDAVGRINKWTAGAIYGKILLFSKDYAAAKTVLTAVVTGGSNSLGVPFDLNAKYSDNFNIDTDNSKESVFSFQASSLDNAGARNGNWGDLLNLPATGPGGAGFFCPTYFFTNKFKTDANGLPVANPNNTQLLDPASQAGFTQYSGNVDTRLDWTIGRNGIPYHDWGTFLTSWQRDPSCGPFGAKKTCIRQSQVGATHDASIWYSAGGTGLNLNLIRFSDVILMAAEIEAGSLLTAFNYINRVRTRAKNSDIVPGAAAKTEPYAVVFANQTDARTALRLERSLELGMEGWTFFDLVRWGIATTELNAYYTYEGAMPYQVLLKNPVPTFNATQNSYYALPQVQIDLSRGTLTP